MVNLILKVFVILFLLQKPHTHPTDKYSQTRVYTKHGHILPDFVRYNCVGGGTKVTDRDKELQCRHYGREFVITVIVITKCYCSSDTEKLSQYYT